MSDAIHRAEIIQAIVRDPALEGWERLSRGLQSLGGFELSPLDEDLKARFEAQLAPINGIFEGYEIETFEDYQKLSDEDLQECLQRLAAAADTLLDGELNRILTALDQGTKRLPVEAIRDAREHRQLMIPRLIRAIQDATSAARDGNPPEGNAHFFALFLLTEFEAAEAFPAILESISLPEELPFDLYGDAITMNLASILAMFARTNLDVLDSLIADRKLNQYVRWEAAQAGVVLTLEDQVSRDEVVQRLRKQLRRALDDRDDQIVTGLFHELTTLAASEALEEIREAEERGLADPSLFGRGRAVKIIGEGWESSKADAPGYGSVGIPDFINELQSWAAFEEKPAKKLAPVAPPPSWQRASSSDAEMMMQVADRKSPRIGRNDPCPCGSGKKFKKCCGARGS